MVGRGGEKREHVHNVALTWMWSSCMQTTVIRIWLSIHASHKCYF